MFYKKKKPTVLSSFHDYAERKCLQYIKGYKIYSSYDLNLLLKNLIYVYIKHIYCILRYFT